MATSSTPSAIQWLAQKRHLPSYDLQTQLKKLQEAAEPAAHVLQHFQTQRLAAIDELRCSSASRLHQLYTSKSHVQSIAMIKYGDKLPMHVH
jgi:hypothetical protein